MADSDIVYSTIDEAYPVAGVDNDTQGFRDNFNTIKAALTVAKTELSDFKNHGVRKDVSNTFASTAIVDASLDTCTSKYLNKGSNEPYITNAIVNFSEGDYQRIVCGADINIEIDGWPATGRYAELSLQIHSDENTVRNITFTAANGSLKKSANFPSNVTIATLANPIIIKFWTHDSGATVFTEYKGIFV
jgi:hypothetical protein|tara:strand:- start:609 stop:1178 length:570 start_codon:yes stop_codon:yes gene_type:complete